VGIVSFLADLNERTVVGSGLNLSFVHRRGEFIKWPDGDMLCENPGSGKLK
jgi:hypothetical protein